MRHYLRIMANEYSIESFVYHGKDLLNAVMILLEKDPENASCFAEFENNKLVNWKDDKYQWSSLEDLKKAALMEINYVFEFDHVEHGCTGYCWVDITDPTNPKNLNKDNWQD